MWVLAHEAVADGVEKMGLAEPYTAVEEQRVVAAGRILGDGAGRRVGELVRAPNDEGAENVTRVERTRSRRGGRRRGLLNGEQDLETWTF